MASTIKIKRSSVAGKVPTVSDIAAGELALNTTDQKLYSSSGSTVFAIGSKQTNLVVSGNTSVVGLLANNSLGTAGYVLKTNGTNAYWDVAPTGGGGGGGTATVTSKTVKDLIQTDTVITSVDGLLYSNANVVTKSLDSIKGSDQVVTSVSGMLVALPTYLQVANAVSTYATKTSPATSGLLAHTGRATISTNLAVSGNTSFGGLVNINYTGSANASLVIQGTNTKGGTGYHDFLMARNGGGGTNPNKWFRITSTGALEIINSAYTANLLSLSDAGALSVPVAYQVSGKQAVNGPAFSAYAAAILQTISSGSQQKVLFQTEEFDTNNNYASSRFTPTVEGYYQLNAEVRLDGATGTGECMIVLYKNGSEYKRGTNQSGTQFASSFWAMQVSSLVYANGTGDYFEIYVQQGSGSSVSVTAVDSPAITWFNGCMMRGA